MVRKGLILLRSYLIEMGVQCTVSKRMHWSELAASSLSPSLKKIRVEG